MPIKLTTDVELAEMLGLTVKEVRDKCRHEWPCVRPKRSVWRFTDAMVEQIIASVTVTPSDPPRQDATGLTPRSLAHHRRTMGR